MKSIATTVRDYLASLTPDRRAALEAVRAVILKNLQEGFEEGMQYGMIGYYVPHRIHPAGYHCDPRQPLPLAALGSQKNHMAVYLMCVYGDGAMATWFREAWAKTGKKLDMGKSCVRFKKVEDLALDVIGEAFRRVTCPGWIATMEAALARGSEGRPAKEGAKSTTSKPAAKAKTPATKVKKPAAKAKTPATKAKKPAAKGKKPAARGRRKSSRAG